MSLEASYERKQELPNTETQQNSDQIALTEDYKFSVLLSLIRPLFVCLTCSVRAALCLSLSHDLQGLQVH